MSTIDRLLRLEKQMLAAKVKFSRELMQAGYVHVFTGNMNQNIYRVHPDYVESFKKAYDTMNSAQFTNYLVSLPDGAMFKL